MVAYQAETANALIAPLQKAIANFALYHQLPILEVQISDSGVSRYETDNEKTAYKYQIDNLKTEILNNGFSALESILSIIESDKDNSAYSTYLASEQRSDNTQNLIWNSIEFHKHNRLGFAASTLNVP